MHIDTFTQDRVRFYCVVPGLVWAFCRRRVKDGGRNTSRHTTKRCSTQLPHFSLVGKNVNFILTFLRWLCDLIDNLFNWATNEAVANEDYPVPSCADKIQCIRERPDVSWTSNTISRWLNKQISGIRSILVWSDVHPKPCQMVQFGRFRHEGHKAYWQYKCSKNGREQGSDKNNK